MREGWKIKKLGEVCTLFTDGDWIESKDQSDAGIRLIQTGNVGCGIFNDKAEHYRYISQNTFDRLKCTEIYAGDILISRLPDPIGRSCIIPYLPDRMITAVDCTIVRLGDDLIPPFLVHYTNSSDYNKKIQRYVTGAVRKRISRKNLSQIEIPIPPLSEQKRIVAELDLLSEVIAKKREQLTQLDALAQSLFYTMFGDPITNEKGWETKSIDKICVSKKEIKRASSVFSKDDRIIYIDISSIDNVNNIIMSPTIYNFGEAPSRAQQVVQKGDILISLVRPNLNNVSLITTANPNLVASSGFCVLRATNEINTQYLFFFVKMDHCREYLMQRVAGANYPAIKTEDIMRYKISLPPLALQQQFAEKIEAIEQQKERIRQSLAEVQLLFDSRMDYYFNN